LLEQWNIRFLPSAPHETPRRSNEEITSQLRKV
jgi:hypothetical protein